jgi:hypothetical protein
MTTLFTFLDQAIAATTSTMYFYYNRHGVAGRASVRPPAAAAAAPSVESALVSVTSGQQADSPAYGSELVAAGRGGRSRARRQSLSPGQPAAADSEPRQQLARSKPQLQPLPAGCSQPGRARRRPWGSRPAAAAAGRPLRLSQN